MNKKIKYLLTCFTAVATILWSLSPLIAVLPVKVASAASATVSFYGSGGEGSGQPFYQIPPMGNVMPASSGYNGLFSFHIKKGISTSTTLSNVKVILTNGGSGTLAADDIAGLAVFKRTSFDYSGGWYSFPSADKVGEKTSAFAVDGATANTITVTTSAIPTDFWGTNGAEYYVAVKTSANWLTTDQLTYKLPADWITVSDGTLGSVCPSSGATCQPASDIYYASQPDNWAGQGFAVEMVDYMGTDSSNNHEIEVRFSDDVDQTSAELATNYNISGTDPASATRITPMAVRLIFTSAVTVTPNQTSLTIEGGGVQNLSGNTLTADAVMMIMGGGGGPGGGTPLYISEVMVGTGDSPLYEFIELYNPSSSVSVNFANTPIKVWAAVSSGTTVTHTKFASLTSGTVAANGYYLIASSQYSGIDPAGESTVGTTYDATVGTCDDTEGCLRPNAGVYLSTSDTQNIAVFDRLGWGTAPGELTFGPAKCSSSCTVSNNGYSLERKANYGSTAVSMASGGADVINGNMYDSHDNQYDFIQRTTADPQGTGITETPGGSGFTTNNYPFINHDPISQAIATQDLIAIAGVMDDSGIISASNVKLYYRYYDTNAGTAGAQPGIISGQACADSSVLACWNSVTGTDAGTNSYRFTIPNANLDATQDLEYFLRAYDGTNYTCLPPGTDSTSGSCDNGADTVTNTSDDVVPSNATPWYVNVQASGGTGTISGRVEDTSSTPNGIPNVLVYTDGMPFTATTNSSGYFTLSGLPDGAYDIRAQGGSYTVSGTTANYLEGWMSGIYLNSSVGRSSTGNTIVLSQGTVENRGGTSADSEAPWVMWSAPGDMMQGYPKGDSLIVVFDKSMQSSVMTGGSATTDNIYLINSSGVIVAGSVIYCDDSSGTDTCTSGTRDSSWPQVSNDPNLLVYNPTADLTPGAGYTLVLSDRLVGQNGQRLMGNRPNGGHSIGFNAAMDFMGSGGTQGDSYANYNFGSGASFPPYVIGTTPGSGGYDTALNTNIYITFNEPMSSSSINTTNIKLYSVANPYSASEAETLVSSYAVTQNTAGDMATIDPASNLTANTHYRVKVLSNCTSADGTPMSNSDNAEQFRMDFDTGSSTDSTAPTIAGTYPNTDDTGVPANLSAISVGFSEPMDPSKINSKTIQLKRGTTAVAGTVEYNVGEWSAYFMPTNVLRPGAVYTITVKSGSTGVKDVVGNALASEYTASFTTSTDIDTTAPFIEFARCDDYSCSITFSEPMNAERVDNATSWPVSVLNPSNYALTCVGCSVSPSVSGARAEYDQMNNTLRLENVSGLQYGSGSNTFTINLSASAIEDKTGNNISNGSPNTFSGTIENSMATGGMMGPGGPGPMMGPAMMMDASGNQYGGAGFTGPTEGGQGTEMMAGMGGSMGFDFGGMWMEPINAMPMNMMAGATTQYMVEFKTNTAIPANGKIKIAFPTGTDVTSAAPVAATKSMPNKDITGPMDNVVVTIAGTDTTGAAINDGVAVNVTARTVTVSITGGIIPANSFVMFDLKGIKNPTVPKSFETNGYTADIKTFDGSNTLLQSETTMPFFINSAGAYTLTGTITATSATGGTASVYVDSWATGPLESEVTFSAGTATYTFTGLPEADYHIHTEPSITLTGGTYIGYMKPEPVWVSSSSSLCSSTTCTKNFSITKESTDNAYELTVYIVGDFSSLETRDSEIDIWAGGPNGHTIKTIDIAQANCTGTSCAYNIYLPSAGEWWIGMGPAMPKGMMMMGPPPMPSWIPPQDVRVTVSGAQFSSPTWDERSGTANDGKISFTVSAASNQIIGYVVDSSGTAISNVDVDAHRTQGGMGMPSHAQTDANGRFALKVATGIYEVNAWMPGMPWSPGRVVDVRADTDSGATDGNATADVYKDNGTTLVLDATSGYDSASPETELLIKLNKSSTTISGNLLDNNGDPVGYAPVWAYNQSTGENMPSGTDSSGAYTIYVGGTAANPQNWNVQAFIPGLGDVSYANNPVLVSGSNRSDINIRPSSDTNFYTISGTISSVSNASVWIEGSGPAGGYYNNHTNTNSSGEYRLTVPGGASTNYTLRAWTPDYGELAGISIGAVTANKAGGTDYTEFSVGSMNTLTINFSGVNSLKSGTQAFIDVFDPLANQGNNKYIDDLYDVSGSKSVTMNVKAGTNYEIHMNIPGLGSLNPSACIEDTDCTVGSSGMPDIWDLTDAQTVTFDLAVLAGDLYTVTVTVNTVNASSTTIADAFVWLGSSGFHSGEPANSSGIATIKVPAGTYNLGADKPGYTSPAPTSLVVSADVAATVSLSTNPYTLSGYIYADANSNNSYDSGEGISNAWVWADKVNSATDFAFAGGWTGAETDADGAYELSISNGFWMVKANSDAYQKTAYKDSNGNRAAIQINSASQTLKNIAMNARTGYTAKQPKSSPVTPANGGTIDDSNNTGVKLTIPPSALGSGTSAGTVNVSETYSVPETDAINALGDKGYDITATNSSGQAVTNLTGAATVEIAYSESDLPTGVIESELLLAYFDNSSGQWIEVPATIDTTNNKITGSTTHFSQYIIGSSADTGGPTQPGTPSASSTSSNSITLTWTASTDSETSVSGYQILRSADNTTFSTLGSTDPWSTGSFVSGSLNASNTYTDSGLTSGTPYYYYVVAFDTAGNHSTASSTLTTATTAGGGVPFIPSAPSAPTAEDDTADDTVSTTGKSSKPDGTLIKMAGSDKIYVVRGGKNLWIPNAKVFEKAGYKWTDIQTVEASVISSAATAELIKSPDSDKVYIIKQGTRIHVANPAVFEAAGYKWSDIATATSGDVSAFVDTNLVKADNSPAIYVLENGMKRHIRTAHAFNSYKYDWGRIATMTTQEVNAYPDNNLIKDPDSDKVYLLVGQTKRWIYNGTVFEREGYNWNNIIQVSAEDLADYTEGAVIE